jgi:hypothetical protein
MHDLAIASSPVIFTALVEVLHKSKHKATMYLTPTNRVLVTKDNTVSSISRLNIKKIFEQLTLGSAILMSSKDGSEQKVAKIDKLNVVTRHREEVLKLWISNDDDLTGEGNYASNTLNYANLEDEKMQFVVLRQCDIVGTRCRRGRGCQLVTSCR